MRRKLLIFSMIVSLCTIMGKLSAQNINVADLIRRVGTGTDDRVANDSFGFSIAIDGNIMVIGAPYHDYDSAGDNKLDDAGAAYVFYKNTGGTDNWGFVKKLVGKGTNGRMASDNFGFSVGLSGDVIVIGANEQNYDSAGGNAMGNSGAAYVFYRNSGGTDNWGFVKKLTGKGTNGRAATDNFGNAVAIDGDIIAVGAFNQDYDDVGSSSSTNSGAIYVFNKNSGGTDNWGIVAKRTTEVIANAYILLNGGRLGRTIAVDGDVIVAGAAGDQYDSTGLSGSLTGAGSAYVFERNTGGTDNWGFMKKLVGKGTNGRVAQDGFGRSLGISGDIIAVGTYQQDYDSAGGNSATDAGAVFIYNRNSGGTNNWGFVKKITGTGTNGRVAGDGFGKSLSISGDTIVVAAYLQDYDSAGGNSITDAGAAYIFSKNSGGTDNWGFVKKITGTGTNGRVANDYYGGRAIALSGGIIASGAIAQGYDANGANFISKVGAVFIYYKNSGGTDNWGFVKRPTARDHNGGRMANDNFGQSVAISGDIMIVGAHHQDYSLFSGDSVGNAGAAYIFYKTNGSWNFVKKLIASGTNARVTDDNFGYSVSIDGDVAIIGAYLQDYDSAGANSVSDAGAVYIFSKNSGGTDNWGLVKKITPNGTNARLANDQFGYSVSISGNLAVVGANQQDYDNTGANLVSNAGAAYVFNKNSGGTDNWGLVKKITGSGTNSRISDDNFGYAVSISSDNVVVGAYQQDYDSAGGNSISDGGAAYIFNQNTGGTNNWGLVKKVTGSGTNGRVTGDNFGTSVAISDETVIVGASQQDYDNTGANNVSNGGAAYIFSKNSGGSNNWGLVKKVVASGTNARIADDLFGHSVTVNGDIALVGAYQQDYDSAGNNSVTNAGAVYEFYKYSGGADNWGLEKKITGGGTNGRTANDNFGYSVALSGNVVLTGATSHDYDSTGANSTTDAGVVFIGSIIDYLVYNNNAWLPHAPNGSTAAYNSFVINGSPALASGAQIKNLTINSGATPSISSGSFTVLNNYINSGTISGAGNITLGGSAAQIVYGSGTTNNLIINNTNGISINNTSGDSLKISGVLTHTAGTLTTNDKLKLVATGATDYGQIAGTGSGSISGNVTSEYQVLTGNEGWRPISSPLNGATLAQFADDLPLNYGTPNSLYTTVFNFNENRTPSWQTPASTTGMNDSCVSIYIGKNGAWGVPAYLDVTGTYGGTTDYTQNNLSYTGVLSDTSGWHYMRNPWPSGFLWDGTISNIQGNQVYLYDQNGGAGGFYHVYDNLSNGVIPPFAALLFQVTSNNVSVTLPNSKRTTDSLKNMFDKTFPVDNYVELGVKKDGQPITDYLKFYTDITAKNTLDGMDGIKKLNQPTMPNIYFTTGIDKLNKQVYNNIAAGTTKLPFVFSTTTNGKYELQPRIENIDGDVEVFIEDLQNNTLIPVSTQPIELMYNGSGTESKYNLVFVKKSANTSINETNNNNAITISQADKAVFISGFLSANTQITVSDILGRVMLQKNLQNASQGISQLDTQQLAAGYYVVTVNSAETHFSQKIIIK